MAGDLTPDELRDALERAQLVSLRELAAELTGQPVDSPDVERTYEALRRRVRAGDATIPAPVLPARASGAYWSRAQVEQMRAGEGGFTLHPKRGRRPKTAD